jgi:carbon monoxide dehydrogenase subunit G
MPKFPTEVEHSVTVSASIEQVYAHFWDVVRTSQHIPGLASCEPVGTDLYRFTYAERTQGPVSITVIYTSQYSGNTKDLITYEGIGAATDNADVNGSITLRPQAGKTRISLRQMLAPDVPVPRLLQGLARPFVEGQASDGVKQYLANVKRALEGRS